MEGFLSLAGDLLPADLAPAADFAPNRRSDEALMVPQKLI